MSRIKDFILKILQQSCSHPGNFVVADLSEGEYQTPIRWCRRCGAIDVRNSGIFRLPDPDLWRG